jgi:pseudouridine-5'-phosphate glycosidase
MTVLGSVVLMTTEIITHGLPFPDLLRYASGRGYIVRCKRCGTWCEVVEREKAA